MPACRASPTTVVFSTLPTIQTFYKDCERAGIPKFDESGRVVDLHVMRTTLATNLVKQGVMPQETQRIMRHANISTTNRHYTDLRFNDLSRAMDKLPSPVAQPRRHEQRATGTYDDVSRGHQICPQNTPKGASRCERHGRGGRDTGESQPEEDAKLCDHLRRDATKRIHSAGVTQLVECQPLAFNLNTFNLNTYNPSRVQAASVLHYDSHLLCERSAPHRPSLHDDDC